MPRSPYGVAKLYAHHIVKNYREAYNLFACNGILFNHESPRRGSTFVSKKITEAACRIHAGQQQTLVLGNLKAKRDWGHAKDYVKAMHLMLQIDKPQDLVIASGESHSIKEFCDEAFQHVGMQIDWWDGGGLDQYGHQIITVDSKYIRPAEVDHLKGDPTLAKQVLNWTPEYTFKTLVKEMMDHDKLAASN
jgi:GDPmannose 4,6-dehydratase